MWSGYDHNTFVSFEPLLEEFHGVYIGEFNWVIIGAETGNRKGKIIPKRSWIETIASSCERRGVPVFMKDSLEPIMGDGMRSEFPKRLS
jgi:protein gp37